MAKFETNLSKKDKQTIAAVLGLGVAFVFGWYLIRPAIIQINALNDDIAQAKVTEAQYRGKIMNLSSAESVYGKAVNDLRDSTDEFYESMPSSGIDRMMTNYILGFGLYPEDLYISIPDGAVEEFPYLYSDLALAQSDAQSTPSPTPIDTSSANAAVTVTPGAENSLQNTMVDSLLTPYNTARSASSSTMDSQIECAMITIVTSGSPEACQAIIDDLCHKESVRITGFEWLPVDPIEVRNEETGEVEMLRTNQARIRVNLNLYMADIADYESMVNDAVEAAAVTEG